MCKDNMDNKIDIVFSGPPGPDGCSFVEVEETGSGCSINIGEWTPRKDGFWALRMDDPRSASKLIRDMAWHAFKHGMETDRFDDGSMSNEDKHLVFEEWFAKTSQLK